MAPIGQAKRAPTNLCEIERSWRKLADQSHDRQLRIKIVTPETYLREDSKKRTNDDVELLACQLIERQPLAEETVCSETASRGFIHLPRVQVSCSRIPGNEQVGHDDIEVLTAGRQIATTVVNHEVYIWPLQ